MPVKIRKIDGYRVSTPGGVKAKKTTKAKAEAQRRLLYGIESGKWKPTGKRASYKRLKKKPKRGNPFRISPGLKRGRGKKLGIKKRFPIRRGPITISPIEREKFRV